MINIAVCDDSKEYGEIVKEIINTVMAKNIDYSISTYISGLSLVDDFKVKRFDIIFLDMEMPGMDGIETGLLIRKISEKAIIFYLTSHKEYAYESYQVKAKNYLLKPLQSDILKKEMTECMEELNDTNEFLDVKDVEGIIHRIPLGDITHILRKKEDRKLHIFVIDKNEIIVNQTLEMLESILSNSPCFTRSGKSCLVNLNNVRVIKKNIIYFFNNETEVASRRCLAKIVNLFKEKNKRW